VADGEEGAPLPPIAPLRSSSFYKATGSKLSLDKTSPQSKSASSIPDDLAKDEGYATFPNSPRKPGRPGGYLEKAYIPEKSISNVDLTDTEQNSLDEAFGRMHDKVHSLGGSTALVAGSSCPQSLQHKVLLSLTVEPNA
jgi:hypothetical protein